MRESHRLQLKFLGVRGSRPTPVAENLHFGGNTTCLEISSGQNDRLLIDAGSGITNASNAEFQGRFHLLLTHFHWDHIQGLPFFAPLFDKACQLTFRSGHPADTAREILERQLSSPYSPVLDSIAAARDYIQIDHHPFVHGNITIHPFPLNHPQGAWGYRLESGGASIVHASDLEHGDPRFDSVLREHAQGANVLIYDAQYTDAEYRSTKGWGHSTWLEATRVARDAGVEQLILFHHDPTHDDAAMAEIVTQARCHFENTDAAQEGRTLSL